MTIGDLIEALQSIGNKDIPVCVHDGMDMAKVKHLIVQGGEYWDGRHFQNGQHLVIQGQ